MLDFFRSVSFLFGNLCEKLKAFCLAFERNIRKKVFKMSPPLFGKETIYI